MGGRGGGLVPSGGVLFFYVWVGMFVCNVALVCKCMVCVCA